MLPHTFNNKNVALKWLQKTPFFQMSFWAQTSLETFYSKECVHPAFPNATALFQCTRAGPFLPCAFYTWPETSPSLWELHLTAPL